MRVRGMALALAVAFVSGCTARGPEPSLKYVGSTACARCHVDATRAWRGSHHDRAMQRATDWTVLGDFSDATFRYGKVTTKFFRRDGRFMVNTDGPDGQPADFEVRYTFGVDPLQQYLIGFPGGRLQALGVAWDTRPKEQGGQRWFHLYPGQRVTHDDPLHWTRSAQNWNLQCAVCHSTDLHKNYDAGTHAYRTRWTEVNVACEACHGPGSRHVAWAGRSAGARQRDATRGLAVALDERRGVAWARDPATGLPRRATPRTTDREIAACARCHSSRTRLFDDDPPGAPLLQSHLPALLIADLYAADGQLDGEAYEYGSFLQSRMNHEGVTCSDCHDPHRGTLRAAGNALCGQCHEAARYDTTAHHHHRAGTAAAQCVTCHMPSKTFMVIDARHDHSLRIPRPDISDSLRTPNVCGSCHAAKGSRWAAARIRAWTGAAPSGFQTFAPALAAARRGDASAGTRAGVLFADTTQPAIARGTAVAALAGRNDAPALATVAAAVRDADPWIRLGGVLAAGDAPSDHRWELLGPALRDSNRVLRALAGGALAGLPIDRVPPGWLDDLTRARAEYVAGETENADQPFALVNLGTFRLAAGDTTGAEQALRDALVIDPDWIPACANLADLLRATGRDPEGEAILRAGLARHPDAAPLHHALGLLMIRGDRRDQGLAELARAARLNPDEPRFTYVYAVGLSDRGRIREAVAVARRGLVRHPDDPALTDLMHQLGAR